VIQQFAEWLSFTSLSISIQVHSAWVIPTIQSVHIVAIGISVGAMLMIELRVLGLAGRDQSLRETTDRFGPWLLWAVGVLLVTGILMVVGEPARQLLAISFWIKIFLLALGTLIAVAFVISFRKNEQYWEQTLVNRVGVKLLAVLNLFVWVGIIFMGRMIGYDFVWGLLFGSQA
jgi:putative copper export protein